MSKYIIGDVQGCFDALMNLIDKIQFNPKKDELIFCGDLVNRGGQSLEVLKWVYKNRKSCQLVLGNHDLSMMAQYYLSEQQVNPELQKVFEYKNVKQLIKWLLNQELIIDLKKHKSLVVHAGIYPFWGLNRAKKEAEFTMQKLRKDPKKFFSKMYGSKPNYYSSNHSGMDRARFAINSMTRMRYLHESLELDFKAKGGLKSVNNLKPWFDFGGKVFSKRHVIFGHWSALGYFQNQNVTCIDTGKVWGGKLTAIKLSKKSKSYDNSHNQIIQV